MDETKGQSDNFPVVILGAGLAGLVAGVHLASRGIQPLLLEADNLWAGGRLSGGEPDTFEYQGNMWSFKPDHGVHALWGNYHNLRATIDRFLPEMNLRPSADEEWINRWKREVRTLNAGNAIRSRWLPAPLHYLQLLFHPGIWQTITPLDFLSLPGFIASILLTVGFDPMKEQNALDGLLMKEYFRGWTPNLKATFVGVGQNLLAAPHSEIELASYIAALRFYTMLRRDSWQLEYFPADSQTSLIQPLIDQISQHGGAIRYGATAKQLDKVGDSWRVIFEDAPKSRVRTVSADHVILAMNAPSTQRLLLNCPVTQPEAEKIIFPKPIRNIVIRLWFSESPRQGTIGGMLTGDFRADNFFWLHRLYDDCREWHGETDGSAVEVHFYGEEALMEMPERNLIILAVDDIQRAFPDLKGSFVHASVRRNSKVHTRFRVPTQESLFVDTPWDGLYACGDWIGYDTPSMWMERTTVTGIASANAVLKYHDKEEFTIFMPERPEWLAYGLEKILRGQRFIFAPIAKRINRGLRRLNQ